MTRLGSHSISSDVFRGRFMLTASVLTPAVTAGRRLTLRIIQFARLTVSISSNLSYLLIPFLLLSAIFSWCGRSFHFTDPWVINPWAGSIKGGLYV